MNESLLLALASAFGVSGIVSSIVTFYLARSAKREERKDASTAAGVADQAAMRSELWTQLEQARQRNDDMAQERGKLYQERAEAIALAETRQKQNDDLLQRYSVAAMGREQAESAREKDRQRYEAENEKLERDLEDERSRRAAVERLLLDKEAEIARLTRGGTSRATDSVRRAEYARQPGDTPTYPTKQEDTP